MLLSQPSLPQASLQALEHKRSNNKMACSLFLSCAFLTQVNAGPMAYARAFLEEPNAKRYPDNQVKLLKEIFR